jgi:hypothetical protein
LLIRSFAHFLGLDGGGDGALARPRSQRRGHARLDSARDAPQRAGPVHRLDDAGTEPGVAGAVDVEDGRSADEIRRGPAHAEAIGGLQHELVDRGRADEDRGGAKQVRPVQPPRGVAVPALLVVDVAVGAARSPEVALEGGVLADEGQAHVARREPRARPAVEPALERERGAVEGVVAVADGEREKRREQGDGQPPSPRPRRLLIRASPSHHRLHRWRSLVG